ncbi:MAG: Nif3-like dinuclear metal center hexameric protein [Phycisphaerales bacterium]
MKVSDLAGAMESVAPLVLAEEWDNVGLLAGSMAWDLRGPVLLTIDLTEAVLAEAAGAGASAVVSYHPPIWEGLKRVTDGARDGLAGRVVLGALRAGIAVYSPHTALDACAGGVTDWLCDGLLGGAAAGRTAPGSTGGRAPAPPPPPAAAGPKSTGADRRALRPHARRDGHQEVKIVTFVPRESLDQVRSALATAGAGIIGSYRVCSFAAAGVGTFLGEEGTRPAVGAAGRLEEAAEVRLEMVCSRQALSLAMEVLRQFHPYEEPAVDVYELLAKPDRYVGAGRRLTLDRPATPEELASRLKGHLGIQVVNIARSTGGRGPAAPAAGAVETVSRVGVCPGSGASLAAAALDDGCEAFVTGEMKHHEVLWCVERGMSVILAGHTNTERGYLPRLAARLGERLRGVEVRVSGCDRSPRVPV